MSLRTPEPVGLAAPSYEEYVGARWTRLYRTAYLLAGNRADAEDLARTTLVTAYRAWGKGQAGASPDASLIRILVQAFLGRRRRARVTGELVTEPPPASGDGVDRLLLWPHLAALSPRQRAVLVLRHHEQLTEQQIAEALGCSPGTVASIAAEALKALRARVAETEGERS